MREPHAAAPPSKRRFLAMPVYIGIGTALVAVAFYGTSIYNYYIPDIAVAEDFHLGLLIIPILGGVAAFLSPCAFGMLPAYFAAFLALRGMETEGEQTKATLARSLRYGAATAAGMVVVGAAVAAVIGIAGAAFAPGLRVVTTEPNTVTRSIRFAGGLLLVTLGIAQLRGRPARFLFRLKRRQRTLSRRPGRPMLWFFGYGMFYLVVALPCVANLMAAPLLYASATGGFPSAAFTVLVFLSTMAVMTMLVSVLIGLSKDTLIRRLGASGHHISMVAGSFFLGIGIVLTYLSINLDTFRSTFFHFPIRG